MFNGQTKQWHMRPLLTETLPYEVPVLFSNDRFFQLCSRKETQDPAGRPDELSTAIKKLLERRSSYSIPYNYSIRKNSLQSTTLSIIHPRAQLDICDLYQQYRGALLSYCGKSEYSIRFPVSLAAVYAEPRDAGQERPDSRSKEGLVQATPGTEELNTTHITSFFAYEKYNILAKFYDSKEFLNLESKFSVLRTLDVSKCFYNIYTHSVSWAVKDKKFAKENANSHSFEGFFDKAMQSVNYNETNGIVVGPEVSRIFAEIVLQEIDLRVQRELIQSNLFHNRDYAIRRYVDDYSIFARSSQTLDQIELCISKHLESFKLYLNTKKRLTTHRPFVTPLTIAKSELDAVLESMKELVANGDLDKRSRSRNARSLLTDIRTISKKLEVELASLSGLLVAHLKVQILKTNANSSRFETKNPEYWGDSIHSLIELLFYICALDPRVRTTYSLCQAVKSIHEHRPHVSKSSFERIAHLIHSELLALASSIARNSEGHAADNIELFNILICGAHYVGPEFVRNTDVRRALKKLLDQNSLSYFQYITLKFCFLKDKVAFSAELGQLNMMATARITGGDFGNDAEIFLLLCDYLSAPDVEIREKRKIFDTLFGGGISAASIGSLSNLVGFVDWNAMHVDHALRRKELRPIYAVA